MSEVDPIYHIALPKHTGVSYLRGINARRCIIQVYNFIGQQQQHDKNSKDLSGLCGHACEVPKRNISNSRLLVWTCPGDKAPPSAEMVFSGSVRVAAAVATAVAASVAVATVAASAVVSATVLGEAHGACRSTWLWAGWSN